MSGKRWSAMDLQMLREHYADSRTDDLASRLKRNVRSVYQKADALGLRKSAEYLASEDSGRGRKGEMHPALIAAHFQPGMVPWNKGTKGVMGHHPECRRTQFKTGNKPQTWQPIGTERIDKDGNLTRKVSDTGNRRVDWRTVSTLVWEAAHGPVDTGHFVVFKTGMKTAEAGAITPDKLECVNRSELMRRNSVHTHYPPELARLVILRGAINRQINKRAKHEQDHQ